MWNSKWEKWAKAHPVKSVDKRPEKWIEGPYVGDTARMDAETMRDSREESDKVAYKVVTFGNEFFVISGGD